MRYIVALMSLLASFASMPAEATTGQFANPIGQSPDPSVIFRDGSYYSVFPAYLAISVAKSPLLETVYQPSNGATPGLSQLIVLGTDYQEIWAPEIKYIAGDWYIYACAKDSSGYRRMFVLKGTGADPTTAVWSQPVDLLTRYDPSRPFSWELDGNVLEKPDGSLYFVFAAGVHGKQFPLNLYIAPMGDPMTLAGPPVLLSEPTFDWEKRQAGGGINEGPAFLYRDVPANDGHSLAQPRATRHRTILVFSASGAFGPAYCLGMLVNDNGNVLDRASWQKYPNPVFTGTSSVISPGHNSFVKSPDGTEDWIVYHSKYVVRGQNLNVLPGVEVNNTVDSERRTMAQRFTWTWDNLPDFGDPIPDGQLQDRPSGEVP